MVWPDISRKIWSYIIAKLGLFTNVDSSKLELSGTSLRLNNVEVEPSKLSNSGVTITKCVIGKLSLELKYSGLTVDATDIHIEARMNALKYSDLDISTILENTKSNIAEISSPVNSEKQVTQPGMVSKLADLALSQVNAKISNIEIQISLNDGTVVTTYIEEAFMSSKHCIVIETVAIMASNVPRDSELYSDKGQQKDSNDTEEEKEQDQEEVEVEEEDIYSTDEGDSFSMEDPMARSIFFDAAGTLHTESKMHSKPRQQMEIAAIDRITLNYQFSPSELTIEVDKCRVDGLQILDVLVTLINESVEVNRDSGDPSKLASNAKSSGIKDRTFKFTLQSLEIYESLENISAFPILLTNLHYEFSKFTIAELEIPRIVHISPFLDLCLSEKLELRIIVPISASISLSLLSSVKRVGLQIVSSLQRIKQPDDAQRTPITIILPEIRLQVGEMLTIHIFPETSTESGLQIREITIIAAKSQLLIRKADVDFGGSLMIDSVILKLSCGFLDEMNLIKSYLTSESHLNYTKPVSNYHSNASIPEFQLNIRYVEVDGHEKRFGGTSSLKCKLSPLFSTIDVHLECYYNDSRANVDLNVTSKDSLVSFESDVRINSIILELRPPFMTHSSHNYEKPFSKEPEKYNFSPIIAIRLTLVGDAQILVNDIETLISVDQARISFDGPKAVGSISKIALDLVDPSATSSSNTRIPILRLKDITGSYHSSLRVVIGRMAVKMCADTYNFITVFLQNFMPPDITPKFQVEPDVPLNIFEDVSESQFVPSNLKIDGADHIVDGDPHKLYIQEDYLGGHGQSITEGELHIPQLLEVSTLWGAVSRLHLEIRKAQWQLYDGYDFQRTREQVKDAILRVTKVANDLEDNEDSDDESESAVVGDFMYNSLLITTPISQSENLQSKIAREIGSSVSLGRSVEPKLVMSLRKLRINSRTISQHSEMQEQNQLSVAIRDLRISDLIKSSQFKYMLSPAETANKQDALSISIDTIGPKRAPELRVNLQIQPLRLSIDQDTAEFLSRFFQFSNESSNNIAVQNHGIVESDGAKNSVFIQRFEFGGVPIIIDYMPKKVDYKSLRSGMAAELLNLFAVKGSKLALKPTILHGVDGWDRIMTELFEVWAPDIRSNQLSGLISGISPIRKALKVSKGVGNYTIMPIKRTQITKGAGVVVKRTLDELLRLGYNWLDSTDRALAGE